MKIRIVIADDNPSLCAELVNAIGHYAEFDIVGIAHNGHEAISHVIQLRPDVLILDLVMPKLDGISVLEKLTADNLCHQTKVIVLSAMSRDDMTYRATQRGASYVFLKPYSTEKLVSCIRHYCSESHGAHGTHGSYTLGHYDLNARVIKLFNQVGLPPHTKGREYLRIAIIAIHEDVTLLNRMTTHLYPAIAQRTGASSKSVERAIRNTINLTFQRGDQDRLDYFMGQYMKKQGHLTNSEFISGLVHASREFAVGNTSYVE